MGAYLSEPNVETVSENGGNELLSYGASAMQGWRVAQEDAHNCITKLDDNTSLFAVYDGHGGAEVAIYTAQQFPKLLKELESYKNGDLEGALKEAFMKFDASLKNKATVEKLKRIAGVEDIEEKEDDGETEALLEEADLPLEQLVAKYCSHPSKTQRAKLKQSHKADLLSPVIHKAQPRFPLKVENGGGDGPVPNKTVPFDDEGDIVPKKGGEGNGAVVNGPDGDKKREGENGIDSDDEDVEGCKTEDGENGSSSKVEAEPIQKEEGPKKKVESVQKEPIQEADGTKEAESIKKESESTNGVENGEGSTDGEGPANGKTEEKMEDKEEAGPSGNGEGSSSGTKDSETTSGISLGTKFKEIDLPDDDDSEDDEDYNSEEEEEEEDDDEDEEFEDEEDDEDEEDLEQEDFDEEEEEEDDFFAMQQGKEEPGSDSGSTAVVSLLRGKELIVGNIGDSRCVLSRRGEALDMSFDHKPEDEVELRRIENAGGKVTPDGRVNGGLNLSRAFGDHCYKLNAALPPEEQMISAFPDIKTTTITDEDSFMVIACDGIWNAMTSQEVIDFVQQRLSNSKQTENRLSKICEQLFDFCLAPDTSGDGTGCDNMTCVIVEFHFNGKDSVITTSSGSAKRKSNEDCEDDMESKKPRH